MKSLLFSCEKLKKKNQKKQKKKKKKKDGYKEFLLPKFSFADGLLLFVQKTRK